MNKQKPTINILAVDDVNSVLFLLKNQLRQWGFNPFTATNGHEALKALETNTISLIISDQEMPQMDGLELLKNVKSKYPDIPFIMLTGYGTIDKGVESIKNGADDYVLKPYNLEELLVKINHALMFHEICESNKKLKDQLLNLFSFQNIITRSPTMMKALKLAEKVSKSVKTTVCISGESGTGKELMARAIHFESVKMENNFIAINCAGIPSGLLESELFGHVKGAFTGADKEHTGKFELAQGGTILLDEIGDMPLDLQPKILRIIQERVYEKIGSNKLINADFRIITATHRDLGKLVKDGMFREDLFHRINSFPIALPPLRYRTEDIPFLANHFLKKLREEVGKSLPGIAQKAMEALMDYNWPGNVRELKNCIERATILADNELINLSHLHIKSQIHQTSDELVDNKNINISIKPEEFTLENVINKTLSLALEKCKNNKSKAAGLLKVDRRIYYRKKKE